MSDEMIRTYAHGYNINDETLSALLADFELIPRGEFLLGQKEVDLTFHEICDSVDLPQKVVRRLQRDGAIGKPICYEDFWRLHWLKKHIWGKPYFLRQQVKRYSKKQRENLILKRPELDEKWKRWVYEQYMRQGLERGTGGRLLNPEKRIYMKRLSRDLHEIFGVSPYPGVRMTLKKIRAKAYRDISKQRKALVALEENKSMQVPMSNEELTDMLIELYDD